MNNPTSIRGIRADVAHTQESKRRSRRRWFIAGGVVVVFVLFGFFGLPPIVRAQAVKQLSAALHREVAIERVRINPLALSVAVEGLAIKDRDGGPFVGWKRLYVNFDSWSVFVGEWRFQEIALDGFSGRVELNKDGTFNFTDLIPPPAAPAPAPAALSKPGWPLRITKLAVSSAALTFNDHTRAMPFSTVAGPVSFTLDHFRTAGDPKAPYSFSAVTEAGETFNWRGTLSIDPVRSAGDFSIGGFSLKKYAPYYADRVRADVLGGTLAVSAHYAVDFGAAPHVLALDNATVKLTGLQVAERGATTPVIELPSFVIEGLSADGLKPSATIKRIALDQPGLHVRREKDGSINLLTMLMPAPSAASPAAAAAVPTTPATPAAPVAFPDVKLGEFAINGLSVVLEDLTTPIPSKTAVEKIDLSVKNVSLAEGAAPIMVKLSAILPPGGEIGVEGTVAREPLAADLAIKVATLPLAGITPYVEPFLNLRIAGGVVSVDGKARLAGSVASFQGDVNVARFTTVDGARAEDFVKFASFSILGIDATSRPLTAKIAEINLVDPVARFSINADKTTNFSTVLRQSAAAPAAVPAPPVSFSPKPSVVSAPPTVAPAPVWSLGKFTLTNGKFMLADKSVKPSVQTALDQFSGTVTGLSSADLEKADVDFNGKVDGVGSIAIAGKLNARAATPAPDASTDIAIDIKGVDLSPLSPYLGTYAGYELARGSLFVDVKTHLAQRKIDSENVVTLNQFTLGQATNNPLATKLPVRLGIALLKDIDGNIVIDLPVKGSLDDPNFKIGKVVLRVIVNLLVKAATSPFSLIGSMFGGGGDELAYQDFGPGAVSPLDTETKKIETLRKALKSRPALNLDITGGYDAVSDTDALRQQQLDRQVKARLWEQLRAKDPATPPPDQITVSPADEARLVAELFAVKFPSGAVEKSDGAVMAVSAPRPPPPPPPRPYTREVSMVRYDGAIPAPKPLVPASAIVSVSNDMKVQRVSVMPAPADMRRLLAADIPVTDDDLRKLAADRAQHVRDALLAGGEIAATRLSLLPVPAQGKGAKVLLQLK